MTVNDEATLKLPQKLRELRESKGFTKKHLADLAGVSQQAIANFESEDGNKTQTPRLSTLIQLAKALEVSLDSLCEMPFQNSIKPVEALLTVLEVFQPQIEISDGKSAPFVTLSFIIENDKISSRDTAELIKQYQLIQTVREAGEKSNTDTTDTIKAIRQDLVYRYKDLPSLPAYDFLVNYESKEEKSITEKGTSVQKPDNQ